MYYRAFEQARAVTDGFTFYGRVDSSVAETTVDGLESGKVYEILVLAGRDNATEGVGARLVMTTASTTDNVVTDPGLGSNGSIIAGATAGGVVLLLIILIAVVVRIRRRRAAMRDKLEQFGGQDALDTLKEYRSTLSRSRGSMKHAESTTHLSFADKTIVNTVMEVALPGFLLIDYETAVHPGPVLSVRARAFPAPPWRCANPLLLVARREGGVQRGPPGRPRCPAYRLAQRGGERLH